jgi:hypothetical protein
MLVRLFALLVLCAALAATAAIPVAVAQQDPFGPVPQAPPEEPPPPPPPNQQDEGLNRTQELLIGGAGLLLLFGIGWAIVRDARSAAPVDPAHPGEDPDRPKGSRSPPARRVKRGRAKAKAARRARKKNR